MAQTMRVSLPTYNALTDNDVRHYSIFADSDNVLIKEQSRGTSQLGNNAIATITHSLNYFPHCYVFGETSINGRFRLVDGYNLFGPYRMHITKTTLVVKNTSGTNSRTMRYFIFYDDIV